MAYINLDSDKVKVFPSAFRGNGINPESFLTSEGNLTAISSKVTSRHKNYVNEDGSTLEIVLGGYLFKVAKSDITSQFPSATTIYAGIKIDNLSTSYSGVSIPTLVAITEQSGSNHILDTDNHFMGLNFAESEGDLSGCTNKIKILDKSSGSWLVPEASKLKLTTYEIGDLDSNKSIASQLTTGHLEVADDTVYLGCTYTGSTLKNYSSITIADGSVTFSVEHVDGVSPTPYVDFNLSGSTLEWRYGSGQNDIRTLLLPLNSNEASNDTNRNKTLSTQKYVFDNYVRKTGNKSESISGYKVFSNGLASSFIDTAKISSFEDELLEVGYVDSTGHYTSSIKFDDDYISLGTYHTSDASIILANSEITLDASEVNVTGDLTVSDDISTSGDIVANGDISASAGNVTAQAFIATSDKHLKENIVEYHCEKSILDLPVVEFNFIGNEQRHIGCLAQDLQEICPEIVYENASGYLTIEESKIVYLLLDEVKKLKKEVEELKSR